MLRLEGLSRGCVPLFELRGPESPLFYEFFFIYSSKLLFHLLEQ